MWGCIAGGRRYLHISAKGDVGPWGRVMSRYTGTLHMGVTGIAFAMAADWTVRAAVFLARQKSGKWKRFKAI